MPVIKCTVAPGAVLPSYQTAGAAGADNTGRVRNTGAAPVGACGKIWNYLSEYSRNN